MRKKAYRSGTFLRQHSMYSWIEWDPSRPMTQPRLLQGLGPWARKHPSWISPTSRRQRTKRQRWVRARDMQCRECVYNCPFQKFNSSLCSVAIKPALNFEMNHVIGLANLMLELTHNIVLFCGAAGICCLFVSIEHLWSGHGQVDNLTDNFVTCSATRSPTW